MKYHPRTIAARARGYQQGFSAITAVVLIVLFGLLGAYMATLTGVQSLTTTLSSRTDQAWFTANSGAEWGIHQVLTGGSCGAFPATLTITGGSGPSFSVDVTCTATSVTEGPDTYNIYRLTASASSGNPGEIGHVARNVRVSVTDAP